jgi:hypothetical protein
MKWRILQSRNFALLLIINITILLEVVVLVIVKAIRKTQEVS